MGLAAAFLGRDGQPSGTLLDFSAGMSMAELKPVLLEIKTQVKPCLNTARSIYMLQGPPEDLFSAASSNCQGVVRIDCVGHDYQPSEHG